MRRSTRNFDLPLPPPPGKLRAFELLIWGSDRSNSGLNTTQGPVSQWNLSCNLCRSVLGTLWRDKLQETISQCNIPCRQVARKVELNSTFGNGTCNLSRNNFGLCRVCNTVKCMFLTTCRDAAKTLRDKLHETFHRAPVTRKLLNLVCSCNNIISCCLFPVVNHGLDHIVHVCDPVPDLF